MDKKFLTFKKIVIPVLTAIMLLMQVNMAFAMDVKNVSQVADSKIVVVSQVGGVLEEAMKKGLEQQAKYDEKYYAKLAEAKAKEVDYNFNDVHLNDWFYYDVMKARELGLIAGVGNNLYAPNKTITYAEFITILVRVLNVDVSKYEKGKHWASQNIEAAKDLGIIQGFEILNIDAGIPREDMAKFVCRALGLQPVNDGEVIFADVGKNVSVEDRAYVNTAFKEYLIEGVGRNEQSQRLFGYGQTVNRAQLATMALRIKAYKEDKEAYKQERAALRQQEELIAKANLTWEELGKQGGIVSESQLTPEIIEKIKNIPTAAFSGVSHKIGDKDFLRWGNPPGDEENSDWIGAIKRAFPGKTVVTCKELFFGDPRFYSGYYRVVVNGRELWQVEVGYGMDRKPSVFMGCFEDDNIFDGKYDPYGFKMMQPKEGGVYKYE
ncbi:MAG: S-layer homology domain-containing protein [Tepidanaerobacteraceae bacterium]